METCFIHPSAGGPYTITFDDGKLTEIRDILMGELWLCSGQSNMEMPMKGFKNQPVENSNTDVMNSRNPQLRLFTVKRASSFYSENRCGRNLAGSCSGNRA